MFVTLGFEFIALWGLKPVAGRWCAEAREPFAAQAIE